jgi:hypothetical protein
MLDFHALAIDDGSVLMTNSHEKQKKFLAALDLN